MGLNLKKIQLTLLERAKNFIAQNLIYANRNLLVAKVSEPVSSRANGNPHVPESEHPRDSRTYKINQPRFYNLIIQCRAMGHYEKV